MKKFFEAASVKEVKERIALLRPDSERLWGKMTAPQAVAHCSAGLELALGDKTPPRMFVGRLFGWIVKPLALRNDEPLRRNSPTMKELVVQDERDLGPERERLLGLIDRFVAAGPAGCTKHPHSFFWAANAGRVGDPDLQAPRSSSPAVWGLALRALSSNPGNRINQDLKRQDQST